MVSAGSDNRRIRRAVHDRSRDRQTSGNRLPGDSPAKGSAFVDAATALRPGGRVFGSTILGRGVAANPMARTLMRTYNRTGIFHNREDDVAGLEQQLATHFAEHPVAVRGMVALFEGSTAAMS